MNNEQFENPDMSGKCRSQQNSLYYSLFDIQNHIKILNLMTLMNRLTIIIFHFSQPVLYEP